jgi:hypothetical protein
MYEGWKKRGCYQVSGLPRPTLFSTVLLLGRSPELTLGSYRYPKTRVPLTTV